MKIKDTYIVYSTEYKELIKIHRCVSDINDSTKYFTERGNGVISQISYDEFFELLN